MGIKKKKSVIPDLKYCHDCERLGYGIYCTGKCRSSRKKLKR